MRPLLATALLLALGAEVRAAEKPNVLLIVADDLGYGELGCQGNAQIPTPHIDALARSGVRFTDGYVAAPVCGPSRAALLTGRYPQRFGFEFNLGASGGGLALRERTLADLLKAGGYATGMFGKWHLGSGREHLPSQRGFDWFYGFLPACRNYPCRPGEMGKSLLPDGVEQPRYTTDSLAAEAAAFIEKNRDRPWFVYLPFGAVHASPQGGRKLIPADAGRYAERFETVGDPQRRIFCGMLSAMDDDVGLVLDRVRALKLEERTLVIFLSDNGGPTWQTTSGNLPLRGGKGEVLEGGIRIPFMMRWPGHMPAGRVEAAPVISLDVVPTVLAAAGLPVPESLEGRDLLPQLAEGATDRPRGAFCWRYGKQRAARLGEWKMVDRGAGAQLYHLAADIGEAHDLAAAAPAKLAELEQAYAKWNAGNVAAKWGGEGKPAPVGKGKR